MIDDLYDRRFDGCRRDYLYGRGVNEADVGVMGLSRVAASRAVDIHEPRAT